MRLELGVLKVKFSTGKLLRRQHLLPVAVVAIAFGIRFWGLGFGLPYLYHPDEPRKVAVAIQMLRERDPNPHFFNQPSLFLYLLSLGYVPYLLVGMALGRFGSVADLALPETLAMGVGRIPLPSEFLLARTVVACFGGLTALVAWRIGHRHHSPRAGLLAGVLLALSPIHCYNSHFVQMAVPATFFATLSLHYSLEAFSRNRARHYLAAGILAGLAASTKYNLGLIILVPLTAWLTRLGRASHKRLILPLAIAVASALAFLATTPFALLDLSLFRQDIATVLHHYSIGHAGMEGGSLLWYLKILLTYPEVTLFLPAVGYLSWAILGRDRKTLITAVFPIVYMAFMALFTVRHDRALLPVLPYLAVLAGAGIDQALKAIEGRWSLRGGSRRSKHWPGLVLIVALLLPGLWRSAKLARFLQAKDIRNTALEWIEEHIPVGTKFTAESYTPFLDRRKYPAEYLPSLAERPLEWHFSQGADYLLASSTMYARYLAAPTHYPEYAATYQEIFSRLPLVKEFNGPMVGVAGTIRIYRLHTPPS